MHRRSSVRGRILRLHELARNGGAEVASGRLSAFGGHVESPSADKASSSRPADPGIARERCVIRAGGVVVRRVAVHQEL